jgi:hypothetical protein
MKLSILHDAGSWKWLVNITLVDQLLTTMLLYCSTNMNYRKMDRT